MRKAVAHYEKKEIEKATEDLKRAQTVFPENYAVPYYLGLIHLEQGHLKMATAREEWTVSFERCTTDIDAV